MISSLKDAFELLNTFPVAVIRILGIISIFGLSLIAYSGNTRLSALEVQAIRIEEQRASELQAIRELTEEVRSYRQAVLEEARRVAGERIR